MPRASESPAGTALPGRASVNVFADRAETTTPPPGIASPASLWLVRRFGMPFPTANTVAALAGLRGGHGR